MKNVVELSNQIVAAYNAKNFVALRGQMHPAIAFAHFNRGFAFNDREALLQVLEMFAGQLMPDRRIGSPERLVAQGDTVVRVAVWAGTAQADIPGFGNAGDAISKKLCSFMRFDQDGLLVEWHDFG